MILEKFPEYALSEDFRIFTSKMKEEEIKIEIKNGRIVCPWDPSSRESILSVADKLIHDLSDEWRQSADRYKAQLDVQNSKRDAENSKREAELEARFRPTAETEAEALPLTCKGTAQSTSDRTIGRIFAVPSGLDIANSAAGTASKVDMYHEDESFLSSMLRRSGEISGSKSAASDQIDRARQSFFSTAPNSDDRKLSGDVFGDLLTAKDIFYLSQYIPQGAGLKAQEYANALKTFTGGNEIDGGIHSEAWSEFSNWVDAVRSAMHAPPPGGFWLPMPNQYSDALKSTMASYVRYKNKRDESEFDRWAREYGPKPTPPKSFQEKITKYFTYLFDPAINSGFCSAGIDQQQSMIQSRKVLRAALFAWENVTITPQTVMDGFLTDEQFATKDNPKQTEYMKRVQTNFQKSVERLKAAGETDLKMISLMAMQEAYDDGRHKESSLIPISTIEANIKYAIVKSIGLEEQFEQIRNRYSLRIPSYGFVERYLVRGEYSRLPRPRQ